MSLFGKNIASVIPIILKINSRGVADYIGTDNYLNRNSTPAIGEAGPFQ